MTVDMFAPPPGWDDITTTLEALRTNYRELGDFLGRQWDEIESLRGSLEEQSRALDRRARELDRKQEEIDANLQLAEVYKQLAEARCELLHQLSGVEKGLEETLSAARTRFESLEKDFVLLSERKETSQRGGGQQSPLR